MIKRIISIVVLTLFVGGTAMSQQQRKPADQQGQPTKSQQNKTSDHQTHTMKSDQDNKTKKDSTSTMQHSDMKLASDDKSFVMKAAEAGMAEVEMGHAALNKASNEEVKQFAQRMVDDHSKANTELMQLAHSKGIPLPATSKLHPSNPTDSITPTGQHATGLTVQHNDKTGTGMTNTDSSKAKKGHGDHNKMMDKMSKLSGAEFDREYMKHQVADHDKAVALFERQAKKGQDAELKAFAERTLPTLKEHQQMARDIHAKVGGKMNNSQKASK